MQHYLATGFHPEVHAAATADTLQPLPPPDTTRPHVFIELKYGSSRILGRLIVELFTDVVPLPASEFRKRCSRGARGGFQGTRVHKVLRNLGCFGGRSDAYVVCVCAPVCVSVCVFAHAQQYTHYSFAHINPNAHPHISPPIGIAMVVCVSNAVPLCDTLTRALFPFPSRGKSFSFHSVVH